MARVKYVYANAVRGTDDVLAGKFRENDLPKFEKVGYTVESKIDVAEAKNTILRTKNTVKEMKKVISVLKSKKVLPIELEVPETETAAPVAEVAPTAEVPAPEKKKRGRPRKNPLPDTTAPVVPVEKKKRGRPRKVQVEVPAPVVVETAPTVETAPVEEDAAVEVPVAQSDKVKSTYVVEYYNTDNRFTAREVEATDEEDANNVIGGQAARIVKTYPKA